MGKDPFCHVYTPSFEIPWELQHLISGNAGQVEFEQDGFEVHKDNVVIVAEAVHEFNRILSLIHYPTEEEAALPQLPNEAVKSREFKTKFTPQTKRQ
ncbi:3747_t:CDS:2, partial [Ambispora gerdemannii]